MIPDTETRLAEAVRDASGPLCITGGGTRQGLGNPVTGAVLSTAGLSGIRLYEPGALTLVAGAGTPVAEIEAALAAEGQMLPFEPADYRAVLGSSGAPTIGGVVACNISGPRRILAGACRDSLIGVRFVDGSGTVVSNGGRVMKNVTGYDLVKLLCGSYGTLGVLSEVSFKLLPAPEMSKVLMLEGLSDSAAVAAMCAALGSTAEPNGLVHDGGTGGSGRTWIRLEGFAEAVSYRAAKLSALLAGLTGQAPVESDRDFAGLRDLDWAVGAEGDLWRFSVKPTEGPALGAALTALGATRLVYDWSGGLVWALAPAGRDLRPALTMPGHASILRADPATRARLGAFQPEAAPVRALSEGLRRRFDPRGILNPGRMAGPGDAR